MGAGNLILDGVDDAPGAIPTDHLTHVTRPNDRWDLIAHEYYGDVAKMDLIIAANPHIAIRRALPGGLTLRIPILPAATADLSLKTPWR